MKALHTLLLTVVLIATTKAHTVVLDADEVPRQQVIGLFCADNGTFSGLGELALVKEHSTITKTISIPLCGNVEEGTYRSTTTGTLSYLLFVTTGINAVNAAACTAMATDPAKNGGYIFSKILWSGTSGWSPMLGGLNPTETTRGGCDALDHSTPLNSVKRLSVGSVCVTSSSFDFSCGKCLEESAIPDTLCRRPNCHLQNDTALFGQCNFAGDRTLANKVYDIARNNVSYPTMPSTLQDLVRKFWAANEYVTAEMRVPENAPLIPSVLGPHECVEKDMNQMSGGANVDYLCREYTADLLRRSSSNGNGSDDGGVRKGPDDVACVSAMEGVGFLRVMTQQRKIPFAIIRSASNYDQFPLYMMTGGEAKNNNNHHPHQHNAAPLWGQNSSYVTAEENTQTHILGYHYAIATSNLVLMKYLDMM